MDPYASIDYSNINAYDVTHSYDDLDTHFYEGDGEPSGSSYYEQEGTEEEEYGEVEQVVPYFYPSELYNTSEQSEIQYYQKLLDYYNN